MQIRMTRTLVRRQYRPEEEVAPESTLSDQSLNLQADEEVVRRSKSPTMTNMHLISHFRSLMTTSKSSRRFGLNKIGPSTFRNEIHHLYDFPRFHMPDQDMD
jgi:hypothetical protein